ncbi:MAG: hypothetical protein QXH91_08085 [Candidatus Bathyarchaeia archaeon]
MSFIDNLPEKWTKEQLPEGRISLLKEGVITLVGLKTLESEALFTSSEGIGTLRETAKVTFAGEDRYWLLARKVNGVIRRVLLNSLQIQNCTVDVPCVNCDVCLLLGALNPDAKKAWFSRVKLQDLISIQKYEYDEKFRIRLDEKAITEVAGTTPFQEVIIPPGTEFPFIVRLFKPSKFDLQAFLYGNRVADIMGYGSYSKLRGDATTRWLMIADGLPYISMEELLVSASGGKSVEDQLTEFSQKPRGPVGEIISKNINEVVDSLIEEFIEKYNIKVSAVEMK